MRKSLPFISAILLFIAGYSQSSRGAQSSAKLEDRVIDTITHLPEVQRREAYVEKQAHGQRRLQFITESMPDKTKRYYEIDVAEDNGMSTHNHFVFYVYVIHGKLTIKFLDVLNNRFLSLDQWRKSKDHPKE